jgi:methenyltetrahydromethanopterin cyclohydrolase
VTQISGRIAEAGIYRLFKLGLDLSTVKCAWGYAPIMPVHPDPTECMGRANDAILYGGVAGCVVKFEDDQALADLISQAVSSSSKEYGRPFKEIFLDANSDFYKIDPNLFAPALFTIQNVKTGKIFTAGKVNTDLLKRSIGL